MAFPTPQLGFLAPRLGGSIVLRGSPVQGVVSSLGGVVSRFRRGASDEASPQPTWFQVHPYVSSRPRRYASENVKFRTHPSLPPLWHQVLMHN